MALAALTKPARLRDQVYDAIRDELRTGSLEPGTRLNELALAEMLGVSRTPIREALFQLARDGLLQERARGYALPDFDETDLQEILELRLLLEPAIAAAAAQAATPAQVGAMAHWLAEEQRAVADEEPDAFIAANIGFREAVFAACPNRRLAECASRFNDQIQWLRRRTLREAANRRTTVASHRQVLSAIEAGNADAAETAYRDLMTAARHFTVCVLERDQ